MKQKNIFTVLFVLLGINCYAQVVHSSKKAYPNAIISLTDQKSKIIFYVETNGEILSAINLNNGSILWTINIIKIFKPKIGMPVVRNLELQGKQLLVVAGKHTNYSVNILSGQGLFIGED